MSRCVSCKDLTPRGCTAATAEGVPPVSARPYSSLLVPGEITVYADADIQVWLETDARTQPSVIVPYVRSALDNAVRYKVRAVRDNPGGHSEISQSGTVRLQADTPAALGRMSLSRTAGDSCYVELILQPINSPHKAETPLNYRLPCPG